MVNENINDGAEQAVINLASMQNTLSEGGPIVERLTEAFSKYGQSLSTTGAISERTATIFGGLSIALLNTKKQFDNLTGIDTKSLNTFSSQISDITEMLSKSPVGEGSAGVAKTLTEELKKLGVSGEIANAALAKGLPAVLSLAQKFALSADNGLRLQNMMIQLAGKTGDLSKLYNLVGVDGEHMNRMISEQQSALQATAKATHTSVDVVTEYYAALGAIPGALDATVKSLSNGSESYSLLTASMKIAAGTGRSQVEITKDISKAMTDYNITGDAAADFTTSMTALNNKLGGSFDVVREALTSLSTDFAKYGGTQDQNAERMKGFNAILMEQAAALRATGLSANEATKIARGEIKATQDLSLAQMSLINARSGKAGGLMGGYRFSQMMREGKTKEAQDMLMKQIEQMSGGKLVNSKEASQSQEAAARFAKQTSIAKMFGMGKDRIETEDIMNSMAAKQRGEVDPNSSKLDAAFSTQEIMKRGSKNEETSATNFSSMRAALEGLRVRAHIVNYSSVQKMFSARPGVETKGDTAAQRTNKANLINDREASAVRSGYLAKGRKGDIAKSDDHLKVDINQAIDSTKKLKVGASAALDSGKQMLGIKPGQDIAKENADLNKEVKASMQPQYRGGKVSGKSPANAEPGVIQAATGRVVNINPNAPAQSAHLPGTHPIPSHPTHPSAHDINVHVTGYCIKCKQEIEGKSQSRSVTVAE